MRRRKAEWELNEEEAKKVTRLFMSFVYMFVCVVVYMICLSKECRGCRRGL